MLWLEDIHGITLIDGALSLSITGLWPTRLGSSQLEHGSDAGFAERIRALRRILFVHLPITTMTKNRISLLKSTAAVALVLLGAHAGTAAQPAGSYIGFDGGVSLQQDVAVKGT